MKAATTTSSERSSRPHAAKPRVVAGFGRSGTTWVQDVLAESNSLRAVFEPLHPRFIRGAKTLAHRCLSPDEYDEELYHHLYYYFFENFHSLWADYRIIGKQLYPRLGELTSRQSFVRMLHNQIRAKENLLRYWGQRARSERIIKFVRANMMLGWIKAHFDARIVFIIRHPAAVVLSQMRAKCTWNPHWTIERYRKDAPLLQLLDEGTKKLLRQKLGDVESFTLTWCIENAVALRQASDFNIAVIHYEELVQHGEPEWRRILSALELDNMPEMKLIFRPSQQTWGAKATDAELTRQYAGWMELLDDSTAVRIQRILDATGMVLYSIAEALPKK